MNYHPSLFCTRPDRHWHLGIAGPGIDSGVSRGQSTASALSTADDRTPIYMMSTTTNYRHYGDLENFRGLHGRILQPKRH